MINPIKLRTFNPRPGKAIEPRLPTVRNSRDRTRVITWHIDRGDIEEEELKITRRNLQGHDLTAPDATVIVSEFPNILRTVGVSCCLAIALVDVNRLAGAVIHIYFAEYFIKPLRFALDALNGKSRDLRIGLSGVIGNYGGKDDEIKADVVAGIGRYGPIIYNQMGERGDIAINFTNRTIHSPCHITPPAKF
ncbi:hypothetical protein HZC35_01070 [Candidatus Saganbacteria bacterium]|nr:hypothetical protein [Candidatus Saganbacteria bacterium]